MTSYKYFWEKNCYFYVGSEEVNQYLFFILIQHSKFFSAKILRISDVSELYYLSRFFFFSRISFKKMSNFSSRKCYLCLSNVDEIFSPFFQSFFISEKISRLCALFFKKIISNLCLISISKHIHTYIYVNCTTFVGRRLKRENVTNSKTQKLYGIKCE